MSALQDLLPTLPSARLDEGSALDWQIGDVVLLKSQIDPSTGLPVPWKVHRRNVRGWRLEFQDLAASCERHIDLTDMDIRWKRCDGELHHYPSNPLGLSKRRFQIISLPTNIWPDKERFLARMRLAYCIAFQKALETEARIGDAYRTALDETWSKSGEEWISEYHDLCIMDGKRRGAGVAPPKLEKASVDSLRRWNDAWTAAGRREGALISDHGSKGNRTRRILGTVPVMEKGEDGSDNIVPRSVYDLMDAAILKYHLSPEKVSIATTWDLLLERHPELREQLRSDRAMRRRLRNHFRNSYYREKRRNGRPAADKMHGVFVSRPRPEFPLAEAQIDHCLADIIVVDDETGAVLGRPWITAMIDRCTSMILGYHISFEVPSKASVLRCLAHAFWPKDLRSYRAGHPDASPDRLLRHDWPCEGRADLISTDRGKEFITECLEEVARSFSIEIRQLPPRSPWLKGAIERFFRTMHADVFSYLEGKTFSNVSARGEYDSVGKAKIKFGELRWRLLRWIVDDYHVRDHSGLGDVPILAWIRLNQHRRIPAMPDIAAIQPLLGDTRRIPITEHGLTVEGFVFFHSILKTLRREDPKRLYHVRVDAFDLGRIWLLPPDADQYIEIPNTRPHQSKGVSIYQARKARQVANADKKARGGRRVTPEEVDAARRALLQKGKEILSDTNRSTTAARVVRFMMQNGRFATPVCGWNGTAMGDMATTDEEAPTTQASPLTKASVAPVGADKGDERPKPLRKDDEERFRRLLEQKRRQRQDEMR